MQLNINPTRHMHLIAHKIGCCAYLTLNTHIDLGMQCQTFVFKKELANLSKTHFILGIGLRIWSYTIARFHRI